MARLDDAQLAFLGGADHRMEEARGAIQRHLGRLRRADGRYDAPLAFQVFTATG